GVDAVGALDGVRDRQRDQRLLARGERAVGEDRRVPGEELLGELGPVLADLGELPEVVRVVIGLVGLHVFSQPQAAAIARSFFASRLAPPTRNPETDATPASEAALSAETLPP